MNDPQKFEAPQREASRFEHTPATGTAVPYFLALAVFVAMAYGAWKWWQVRQFELNRGQAIAEGMVGPPLTEFELTERSGNPFRTADMRGKVWVATYFFTSCPGNCIRLNKNIQLMHDMPELQDVTWVSITCDPDNDTVEALRDYADRWQADPNRWLFCRADLDYTRRVARGMNLYLGRKTHQDYAIVVDKWGTVRGMFDATSKSDCQRLRALLVQCVEEESPPESAATGASDGTTT
jgi:cytochrome oxidase Cu insertion factor (SCO1/SenC/PrrC family)